MAKKGKNGNSLRNAPFELGFTGRFTTRPGGPSKVCAKVKTPAKGKKGK